MRNPQAALLYKWFNDVWNNDDESSIDKLMTHDSTAKGILKEGEPKGAEGFKIFYKDFRSQFHDVKIEIEDVIAQDDMEAARTIVNAIHTQTGKEVKFSGLCMVKVVDGKIAEAWNNYDFLNLYEQLGQKLMPAG